MVKICYASTMKPAIIIFLLLLIVFIEKEHDLPGSRQEE